MKRYVVLALAVLMAGLIPSPAHADLLFFSPLGVDPQTYTGPTSPVPVGSGGFRLTYFGGGKKSLVDPILLILGVPTGMAAPNLVLGAMDDEFNPVTSYMTKGGPNVYGGSWNASTGYAGTFSTAGNASSPGPNPKVFSFIKLTEPGVSSQNYSNWSGASGASAWSLYVWSLYLDPNIQREDPDWVEIEGHLSAGTFAIAYGCQVSGPKCATSKVESTPFTRSGFIVTVPEPSSMIMLLYGVGLVAARKKTHREDPEETTV